MDNHINPGGKPYFRNVLGALHPKYDWRNDKSDDLPPTNIDFFKENDQNLLETVNSEYGFFEEEDMQQLKELFPTLISQEIINRNKIKYENYLKLGGKLLYDPANDWREEEAQKYWDSQNSYYIREANNQFYDEFDGGFNDDML